MRISGSWEKLLFFKVLPLQQDLVAFLSNNLHVIGGLFLLIKITEGGVQSILHAGMDESRAVIYHAGWLRHAVPRK